MRAALHVLLTIEININQAHIKCILNVYPLCYGNRIYGFKHILNH